MKKECNSRMVSVILVGILAISLSLSGCLGTDIDEDNAGVNYPEGGIYTLPASELILNLTEIDSQWQVKEADDLTTDPIWSDASFASFEKRYSGGMAVVSIKISLMKYETPSKAQEAYINLTSEHQYADAVSLELGNNSLGWTLNAPPGDYHYEYFRTGNVVIHMLCQNVYTSEDVSIDFDDFKEFAEMQYDKLSESVSD